MRRGSEIPLNIKANGLRRATRLETRAFLRQLVNGKDDCSEYETILADDVEVCAYLTKNLKSLWVAAQAAKLGQIAALLEPAFFESFLVAAARLGHNDLSVAKIMEQVEL